jgi:hypothetical protein
MVPGQERKYNLNELCRRVHNMIGLGILCIVSLDLRAKEIVQEKRQNKQYMPHI